ncbi:hypothetical protein RBTH_07424 [Bacillus thuringiensis serovar israelensis ATCC 35646]|nr:hypothetical protein RBTH_07424 [Bacillus thuringiensis serovar israelensis ATCC 35646]
MGEGVGIVNEWMREEVLKTVEDYVKGSGVQDYFFVSGKKFLHELLECGKYPYRLTALWEGYTYTGKVNEIVKEEEKGTITNKFRCYRRRKGKEHGFRRDTYKTCNYAKNSRQCSLYFILQRFFSSFTFCIP